LTPTNFLRKSLNKNCAIFDGTNANGKYYLFDFMIFISKNILIFI